jgi:hypothetical protein
MLLYNFQKAVYAALDADATLKAAAGIYDYVPEGKGLPFVVIGDDRATEYRTKTYDGWEITTEIVLWDGARGCLSTKRILGYIEADLAKDLTFGGQKFDFFRVEDMSVQKMQSAQNDVLVRGSITLVYRDYHV